MYRFFINRPIVAMVIAILQVTVGLVTMLSLPVAQYPNIVPPEIRIQTTYVGADAQTLAQSVATPIEEQMSRGGQHELHVFRQREQRRDADGREFRRQDGPEH